MKSKNVAKLTEFVTVSLIDTGLIYDYDVQQGDNRFLGDYNPYGG